MTLSAHLQGMDMPRLNTLIPGLGIIELRTRVLDTRIMTGGNVVVADEAFGAALHNVGKRANVLEAALVAPTFPGAAYEAVT